MSNSIVAVNDYFGRLLQLGDTVAYLHHSRTSSELRTGVIVDFTDCFVRVQDGHRATKLVAPYKVIRE